MKNYIIALILLFSFQLVLGQNALKKTRKEIKAERKEKKIEDIKILLENKNFVFSATTALPMGGGSINLSSYFDAKIKNDSIFSYLPFYGRAYQIDYGSQNSPLHFEGVIKNYSFTKDKKGYHIKFETKNKMDVLYYNFQISNIGYASLSVISTNRQAISFYGIIEEPEKQE